MHKSFYCSLNLTILIHHSTKIEERKKRLAALVLFHGKRDKRRKLKLQAELGGIKREKIKREN